MHEQRSRAETLRQRAVTDPAPQKLLRGALTGEREEARRVLLDLRANPSRSKSPSLSTASTPAMALARSVRPSPYCVMLGYSSGRSTLGVTPTACSVGQKALLAPLVGTTTVLIGVVEQISRLEILEAERRPR